MRSPWVTSIIFHSASALLTLVTPGDTGLSDILHGYPVTLAIMGFIVALCKTLSCNPPHTSSRECTITQLTLPSPRHARDFHPLDYGAATRTKNRKILFFRSLSSFYRYSMRRTNSMPSSLFKSVTAANAAGIIIWKITFILELLFNHKFSMRLYNSMADRVSMLLQYAVLISKITSFVFFMFFSFSRFRFGFIYAMCSMRFKRSSPVSSWS